MTDNLIQLLAWIPTYGTVIWLVLTGILVFTLLQINKKFNVKHRLFTIGAVLFALIWLYPLYTQWYYPVEVGFLGNLITLGLSWYYFKQLAKTLPKLSKWLYPQLVWALIATVYTLLLLISRHFV